MNRGGDHPESRLDQFVKSGWVTERPFKDWDESQLDRAYCEALVSTYVDRQPGDDPDAQYERLKRFRDLAYEFICRTAHIR